jgi:tRNA threonylcarbamoyladenosine biosynthesis protein TsaE
MKRQPIRAESESRTSPILISRSPEETHNLGFQIAQDLPVPGIVLLRGSLGTGKTTLARGIACGLGLDDPTAVSSPSFTLVNTYQGRCPIYHVDLFRVQSERDLETVGISEFLGERGVTIVEWGERITFPLRNDIVIEIEDAGGDTRHLRIHKAGSERPNRKKSSRDASKNRARSRHGRRTL